jgi:hypothetical protein
MPLPAEDRRDDDVRPRCRPSGRACGSRL